MEKRSGMGFMCDQQMLFFDFVGAQTWDEHRKKLLFAYQRRERGNKFVFHKSFPSHLPHFHSPYTRKQTNIYVK